MLQSTGAKWFGPQQHLTEQHGRRLLRLKIMSVLITTLTVILFDGFMPPHFYYDIVSEFVALG